MLARAFATCCVRLDAIRSVRNPKYLVLAHKETNDPLWRLLDALRRPSRRHALSEALHATAVSASEFTRWQPVIEQPAIDSLALDNAPSWVLLYFVANKVRSSHHAHGPMLDLVYTHLASSPNKIHGPLILLAAVQLARFGLVVPLQRLAKTFLTIWIEDPAAYFNLMLQVICCIPNHTVESANIAVLLLRAMESRQLKLTSDTYEMLLNDRFVTLQLTKYVQSRMVQEGFVPAASHLEEYLRFFAKDGAIHDAKKYYNAIHAQSPAADESKFFLDPSSIPQLRANTLMLSTHHSFPSAFGFLRKLAAIQPQPTVVIPPVKRTTRTLHRIIRTKFRSIHDFTSTLTVLSRDSRCTTLHLLKFFTKVTGGRPTVTAYTALIRGLLLRGDDVNAVSYWKKLLKSGLTIDSEALAAGVVAITRVGRPYDAFMLLERFGLRHGSHTPSIGGRSRKVTLRAPVRVTQHTINDFMISLNRIDRPDIVFRLWDHMGTLYGISPDAFSLSILLQSARLAHKLDDTLSGTLAHLSLKNPFRRHHSSSTTLSRSAAVSDITTLLYDSNKKQARAYRSGIWHDLEPLTAAKKVFLQVLFGGVVERDEGGEEMAREMLKVESPASAARTSIDDDPAEALGFAFSKLKGLKYVFEPFEDLFLELPPSSSSSLQQSLRSSSSPLQPASSTSSPSEPQSLRSHYPSIFPTNANCLQYILLLTLSKRSHEIPLVLAWMKFLGIQPSNSTLALSLVVWREVSCQAPLIESLHRVANSTHGDGDGGDVGEMGEYENDGREYVRLVRWMRDWVGEKRVPSEKDVGKWMKIMRDVREVKR